MDWPSCISDLKYLSTNILNLDLSVLDFDWKEPNGLKNTARRKQFVSQFAKSFVTKYCSS